MASLSAAELEGLVDDDGLSHFDDYARDMKQATRSPAENFLRKQEDRWHKGADLTDRRYADIGRRASVDKVPRRKSSVF